MRTTAGFGSAIIVTLIACGLTACSTAGRPSSSPSLPPASAASQQVARAYLDAAVAGNCDLTRRLTAATTWAWCDAPRLTGYKNLGAVTRLPASQAGVDLDCYHLTITTTAAPKRGMTAGTRPWTLCFQHTGAGYRLYQQGLR